VTGRRGRGRKVVAGSKRLRAGRAVVVTGRATRAGRRLLRRTLKRRKRIRLNVRVDLPGATVRRKVTLRP
jgi:ribosomal protein L16/L10AE